MDDIRVGICIDCGNLFITDRSHIKVKKRCGNCQKIYRKIYKRNHYSGNKSMILEKAIEYHKKNRDENNERCVEYHKKNKQKINIRHREYYKFNRDRLKEKHAEWKLNNKDKERIYYTKYRLNNSQKIKERNCRDYNRRYNSDPMFRLNSVMRSSIRQSLRGNKNGCHWEDIVGYILQDLKDHLEFLFQTGMCWNNYGQWHIDHIKPKSLFKYNSFDDEEFKQCWVLDNLQPLWAKDNLFKGSKYN